MFLFEAALYYRHDHLIHAVFSHLLHMFISKGKTLSHITDKGRDLQLLRSQVVSTARYVHQQGTQIICNSN